MKGQDRATTSDNYLQADEVGGEDGDWEQVEGHQVGDLAQEPLTARLTTKSTERS
jgi:hypothetical protein